MRKDILDPPKLAAKADEIWQSSSTRSVNTDSAASPPLPAQNDVLNALRQRPQPHPAPHVASCIAPHALAGRRFILFLPEILTWFFSKTPSLFFPRVLCLPQLRSPRQSCLLPVVLPCLVLVLILFLYVLVLNASSDPSSWLLSPSPSFESIFSNTIPC